MRDDNTVEARLKRLEDDTRALKGAQFAGFDSVRSYKVETTNDWDITWTPTWSSPQQSASEDLFMKFIADNQDAPMCNMYITCRINGGAYYRIAYSGDPNGDNGVWFNGTVRDTFGNYSPDRPTPSTSKEVSWYDFVRSYNSGQTIELKFTVYATDTGNLRIAFGDGNIVIDTINGMGTIA